MSDFWDGLDGGTATMPAAAPSSPWSASMQSAAPLDAIQALYTKYHGVPATPDQLIAAQGNPGGLAAIEAQLQAEPKPAGTVAAAPAAATGSDFGAAPAVYTPDAQASSILRQQYVAPQFTEAAPTFTAPTVGDIQNDPGVAYGEARAIRAQQNSAAAKGTVLNANTTAALGRDVQDYSNTQFNNVYNRASNTFQNNLATYAQKYNVFSGNAGLADAADTKNKTAAQQTINNGANAYTTNFNANETSQTDYWNRLKDVINTGASAAAA